MAPMDTSGSGAVGGGASSDEHSTTAQLSPAAAASDTSAGDSHDPGKMFIGGLSWQTTAETLREYFSKFGELTECMVMRDPATRRARGFGFITFSDPTSVDKVLNNTVHELDGKKIDPKVAFPKRSQPKMVTRTKKIFVGGLSASSTVEDMKTYFEQYGKIEDAMLMFDKTTQRHRGFGFVTFESEDVVEKVTEIHFHEINGKMVECKKAQPKEVMLPVQMNKTRAAAARSLYGLAPDQLLAYSSLIPRYGGAGAFGAASPLYYHPASTPSAAAAAAAAAALYSSAGGAPAGTTSTAMLAAALHQQHQQQQQNSMGGSELASPTSPTFRAPSANDLWAAAAARGAHQQHTAAVLNGYKGGWPSAAGPTSPSAAAAALMGHSAFGAPGGAGGGGMSQQQLEAALYTAMCNGALTQAGSMPVELQAAMSQSFSAAATPASPQPGSYAAAALAAAAAAQHQHQAAQQHQASSQQPFAHPAAAQHMMKQQLNGQLITATYNGHGHY